MHETDVVIAGAGVIGMALALELRGRGRRVTLVERAEPGSGASRAAAGMLAANDPAHPADLQPLATLSEMLYPAFLDYLAQLAPADRVVLQTRWTLEADRDGGAPLQTVGLAADAGPFRLLREASIDPRGLVAALVSACQRSGMRVMEATQVRSIDAQGRGLSIETSAGTIACAKFVDCTGAWSSGGIRPVKGQMLRVQLGSRVPHLENRGNVVVRTPSIYVVPRLDGTALIGATVEEKGFCVKTKDSTIADLRARAAALLPAIADAPELERWAGLRPASADGLPSLGEIAENRFVAIGHFRNGILLASGTARVMAELLCGETPSLSLKPFSPDRFRTV